MEYSEEKAAEIIEKFKLSPSTLRVWKNRNKIPDTYAEGKGWGKQAKIKSESEKQQAANIARAINTGKFNIASLSRLAEMESDYGLKDFLRGRAELNYQDFTAIKKAINSIRNDIKKFLSESERTPTPEIAIKNLKKLFLRPEISFYVILDRKKNLYYKFYDWASDKRSFPSTEINYLRGCLLVFLTETTL